MHNSTNIRDGFIHAGIDRKTANALQFIAATEKKSFGEWFGPILESFVSAWENQNSFKAQRTDQVTKITGGKKLNWESEDEYMKRITSL